MSLARAETVVACWWQSMRSQCHPLSDLPWSLVQAIVSHQAFAPVWRGTFAHQCSFGSTEFSPYGIAVLSNGDIVVSEDSGHRVQRMSPNGEDATTIAHKGRGPGQVSRPQGLCVVDDLHVLVADCGNKRVQRLRVDGSGAAQQIGVDVLLEPSDVAVHNGNVYVADYFGDCITVFSEAGIYLRAFGTFGTGTGQFSCPTAVSVTSHGYVVVAEPANDRVQVLKADGTHLRFLLRGQLRNPFGVVVDGNNIAVIAATGNHRVLAVSVDDGRVLAVCENKGLDDDDVHPTHVTLLADGSVAFTDSSNKRVQIV